MRVTRATANAAIATVAVAVLATACSSSKDDEPASSSGSATQASSSTSAATTAASSAPAAAGKGACKYVTVEQASQLAGSPVKAGVERSLPTPPITFDYCDYIFDPGNAPGVTVAIADLDGNASSLYQQFRTSKQGETDFQDVAGVGDAAFYSNGNINILKGNKGVILYVGRSNSSPRGPDAIPDEKKLADIVLPQL